MHISFLLGVICLAGSVAAQQYTSGPVPPRPQSFAGAIPVESSNVRPRQRVLVRPQVQETPQPQRIQAPQQQRSQVPQNLQFVRSRRPQPPARARNLVQDERASPRISTGDVEDVYLNQRLQTPPPQPKVQQPLPQTQTARLVTQKPVVEEEEYTDEEEVREDEDEPTSSISRSGYVAPFQNQGPSSFQPQQRPIQYQQQQQAQSLPQTFQRPAFLQPAAFRPSPPLNLQQQSQQVHSLPQSQSPIVKQFTRPTPQVTRPALPVTPVTRPPPPPNHSQTSSEEEEEDEPQYYRQPVKQQQQQQQQPKRPAYQQNEPEPYRQPQQKPSPPARQQITRTQDVSRPYPSKAAAPQKEKERKPVSQTVNKFHEENEDGSITWGYENDDGTFKEETIGVDCVTRGKYGYVDPDGVKREYTYQTGIPCDREAEAEQAASANEGYIDYSSNKYVFPNGDEIDLDAMVKNRARKPTQKYRN